MSQGRRRSPLPSNWSTIRYQILVRDHYTCQLAYTGCIGLASEVDHINSHTDHQPPNLRAVCTPCHQTRTSQQIAAANRRRRTLKRRPTEPHPGVGRGATQPAAKNRGR